MCIFQGLENYIQTLPSEDEFTALKNRCRAKEDECGRLNMKITSLALKLEKSGKEVKGLLDSRDSSEIQVHRQRTQWCKFLSQEVRENRAIFVALPREFPLSICATFTRKFQIITQNYTPLSIL